MKRLKNSMNWMAVPVTILMLVSQSAGAEYYDGYSIDHIDGYSNAYNDDYGDSYSDSYTDTAKVLKVKPIYETVEVNHPETHCWKERVHYPRHHGRHYGGMITGGILGGLAGHQVGRGRGKDVATVIGTIAGAAIGDNIAHSHHRPHRGHHSRLERHCETVDNYVTRKEVVAYRVKYRYKGHSYWTQTEEHPGATIQVAVDVHPIE